MFSRERPNCTPTARFLFLPLLGSPGRMTSKVSTRGQAGTCSQGLPRHAKAKG